MTKVCDNCKSKLKEALKEDADKMGIDLDTYLDIFIKTFEETIGKLKNECDPNGLTSSPLS